MNSWACTREIEKQSLCYWLQSLLLPISVSDSFFLFYYSRFSRSRLKSVVSLFLFPHFSLALPLRLRLNNFRHRQNYAKLCSNGTLSSSFSTRPFYWPRKDTASSTPMIANKSSYASKLIFSSIDWYNTPKNNKQRYESANDHNNFNVIINIILS